MKRLGGLLCMFSVSETFLAFSPGMRHDRVMSGVVQVKEGSHVGNLQRNRE